MVLASCLLSATSAMRSFELVRLSLTPCFFRRVYIEKYGDAFRSHFAKLKKSRWYKMRNSWSPNYLKRKTYFKKYKHTHTHTHTRTHTHTHTHTFYLGV
jgi:hypothetical protein